MKKKSNRAARREADREVASFRKNASKVFAASPGGSRERPIVIVSASEVLARTEGARCAWCDGALRASDHEIDETSGRRLRRAIGTCRQCHAVWTFFFELPVLN